MKKDQGTTRAISSFIDPSLNWDDIKWFQSITNMPILLKGIQCAEDAIKAVEYGVQGIVCSNHGGRQIDTSRSGIEVLEEVMDALRERGLDVELVALGGPRTEWLQGIAKSHGVEDALICQGEVQHHELAPYYRGADLVLVASHREGFGLVGLEAMACGTGVVSTAVGGMKLYTEHNRNAWVVEPQNVQSIADGLSKMLGDSDLRTRLSSAALETVAAFSVEQSALKLEAFYQDILATRT